jgi:hypothetical protein
MLGFVEGNQCAVFSGPTLFGYTTIRPFEAIEKFQKKLTQ